VVFNLYHWRSSGANLEWKSRRPLRASRRRNGDQGRASGHARDPQRATSSLGRDIQKGGVEGKAKPAARSSLFRDDEPASGCAGWRIGLRSRIMAAVAGGRLPVSISESGLRKLCGGNAHEQALWLDGFDETLILSILRIVTALVFLQYGLSKAFGFPDHGPPLLTALLMVAAALEIVGGAMLVFGAYTRIVAFILSGEMAVAYFMAHAPKSFYPIVNGGNAAILFCFVFLYLAFAGGGPLSLDRIVLKQK
jgi:putative oxidoreductase